MRSLLDMHLDLSSSDVVELLRYCIKHNACRSSQTRITTITQGRFVTTSNTLPAARRNHEPQLIFHIQRSHGSKRHRGLVLRQPAYVESRWGAGCRGGG